MVRKTKGMSTGAKGNFLPFVLDTRSARMIHDHLNRDNPEKSLLGKQQLDWLLNGIRLSDADFIFVVSSVNFMIPHVSGGEKIVSNKDDAWTAFQYEREILITEFEKASAPVFILTGDLHPPIIISRLKGADRLQENLPMGTGHLIYGGLHIFWKTAKLRNFCIPHSVWYR